MGEPKDDLEFRVNQFLAWQRREVPANVVKMITDLWEEIQRLREERK